MKKYKAWFAAGLIFVAGGAVGAAVVAGFALHVVRQALAPVPGATAPIDRAARRLEKELRGTLSLAPAQAVAVDAEVATSISELKQLRGDSVAKLQAILNEMVLRIGSHLAPDQQAKLYTEASSRFQRLGLRFEPPPAR